GRLTCRTASAIFAGALCLFFSGADRANAGDWPQILGPHRNGIAAGEQIVAWPKSGPKLLWERAVGSGFAGPAIVGGRAIIFHRTGGELVAEALDASTGKPIWKTTFETNYRGSISPDNGPRCVPLVHGGRVYLVGPGGELACVTLGEGKKVWSRPVYQEFGAPEGYFGAGSSPIVEGDKLLMNVGAPNGAGLVAFSLADGKTVWQATDEAASYSSPVAATVDGVRHIVFVTRLHVVSIDPANGRVRFRLPFGQRGPTVNAANPLVLRDHLFVSASYGVGARWAKIGANAATQAWESDEVMSSQYTTSIEYQGVLYGLDGRQDVGVARLRAFDPVTRKIYWTQEDFGTGSLILAGDRLLVMKTDGELVLAEPTPKAYRPLAAARLFDTTVQALPALSGGLLLARDTQTLKCFRVGK
ncbi:MAG TPA: PQQ-binding-like beta-propeller repeat protein, partial [Pirellulales bacterium]|nr:PQQ-binding-like beta-propeller repeat protein [Pirellulales bacterium]